jgi:hypothetical protein
MSMMQDVTELGQTTASTRNVCGSLMDIGTRFRRRAGGRGSELISLHVMTSLPAAGSAQGNSS